MISLRAISLLVDDLFQLDGISFVLTRRLNQDPLEVSYFLFSNNEEGFKLRSTSVYCLYVQSYMLVYLQSTRILCYIVRGRACTRPIELINCYNGDVIY